MQERACAARCAGEPAFCSDFIGEHGLLEGRQQGIEVGACDGGDGNGDQFSGVSPSRWRSRGVGRLLAHQIGCCMPDTSSSPEHGSSMNSGMPSKAAVSTCPLATATFMARSAYRRLVGLNEERA